VRVKICGITSIDDARLAVELGAWAIGFVFWPSSPRFIEPSLAREIVERLPAVVTAVGVFVNQPAEHVEDVSSRVRLGAVQLHGDESPRYAHSLSRRVIKAFAVDEAVDPSSLGAWGDTTILLDASDSERRGGTGRTIDWQAAAHIARARPIVLAGGMRPDNVAEAVRTVRPAAVDVSSGVERSPGRKDAALMEALFAALAGAQEVRS
jgi:phosphoribosylanthranilate isomerase